MKRKLNSYMHALILVLFYQFIQAPIWHVHCNVYDYMNTNGAIIHTGVN